MTTMKDDIRKFSIFTMNGLPDPGFMVEETEKTNDHITTQKSQLSAMVSLIKEFLFRKWCNLTE